MKKKFCKDLKLVAFNKARRWIKKQAKEECAPVYIEKYGGKSRSPFRVWLFADVILLMSNEQAKMQSQYVLSVEKWGCLLQVCKTAS